MNANVAPRTPDEAIAHFIPRWNVETWVRHFNGSEVHEDDDSYRCDHSEIGAAADAFYNLTRRNALLPPNCLPSIFAAITEARRLEE